MSFRQFDDPALTGAADPGKRVFHTLDAMRMIAAVAVVVFHYNGLFGPLIPASGGLAVDLFFMMSGVVISRAYEGRFRSGMGPREFMTIRLIRLYPLYFLSLVPACLVALAAILGNSAKVWRPSLLATDLFLALFMLPGVSPGEWGQLFPLNVPTWSLFFEILINFAFVCLWPLLSARRLAAACLLCVPILAYVAFVQDNLDAGWLVGTAWIGAVRTIFGFSLGVMIARSLRPRPALVSLPIFLALLGLVALALFATPPDLARPAWSFAWVVILFPTVVYAATRVEPPTFLAPTCALAGISSYAVYVLHYPTMQLLASLVRHFSGGSLSAVGPLSGSVMIAAFLIAGWILDLVYDAPVRRMLRSLAPRSSSV
jgi:peptidoglycan/LPS O-acetylase OafA/YrhL